MYPTMTALLLRHNSNYGGYSEGQQRLKRCVCRRLRKTNSSDDAMNASRHLPPFTP